MTEQRAAEQRALYGTTLAERFGAVMQTYGLTQRTLAQTLGLSAPMLSQLINAQRIKIGNPAVYERLVMLESRAGEGNLPRVVDEVRESNPVLSTQTAVGQPLHELLAEQATPNQLESTANAARELGAQQLAEALSRAASLRRR